MASNSKKHFWQKIIGFRSGTPWKMVIAGLFYFNIAVFSLTASVLLCLKQDTVKTNNDKPTITNEQLREVSTDPDRFKGYPVEFTGKVFGQNNTSGDRITFQMWGDPQKSEFNIAVEGPSITPALKNGEFVKVSGYCDGKIRGSNAFNAQITAIAIKANCIERINPVDALAPIKIKKEINQVINQSGYIITLKSVEFADTETRVYLSIKNETGQNISFYKHAAKAVQQGAQFERHYSNNYPEIQSDILPNVLSDGVIVFDKLDPNKPVEFHFTGSFSDYRRRFQPVVFLVDDKILPTIINL